jgi:stearoyl-CoA desaturase (delta-9 desaturase)
VVLCYLWLLCWLVLVWHATWLVNSACHTWGHKPFKISDGATNPWWVAFLTFGEGWHNHHHENSKTAKYGLEWWQIDMNYLQILLLEKLGLAKQVVHSVKPCQNP